MHKKPVKHLKRRTKKKIRTADGRDVEVNDEDADNAFGDVENNGEIVFVQRKVRGSRILKSRWGKNQVTISGETGNLGVTNQSSTSNLYNGDHLRSDVTLPTMGAVSRPILQTASSAVVTNYDMNDTVVRFKN